MWGAGEAYERFMGRWSALLGPPVVDVVRAAGVTGGTWLDVGCGTGSFVAAALAGGADRVVAVEPSPTFAAAARERFATAPVEVHEADATSLPAAAAGVDAVLCGLVLNFTPDPVAALRAMARVLRPGGVATVAVWDYGDERSFLHRFWAEATAVAGHPLATDERTAFDVCTVDGLARAAAAAGWPTDVTAIDVPTTFVDEADLWEPFLGGIGPAGAFTASLDDDDRDRLRERVLDGVTAGEAWPVTRPFRAHVLTTRGHGSSN